MGFPVRGDLGAQRSCRFVNTRVVQRGGPVTPRGWARSAGLSSCLLSLSFVRSLTQESSKPRSWFWRAEKWSPEIAARRVPTRASETAGSGSRRPLGPPPLTECHKMFPEQAAQTSRFHRPASKKFQGIDKEFPTFYFAKKECLKKKNTAIPSFPFKKGDFITSKAGNTQAQWNLTHVLSTSQISPPSFLTSCAPHPHPGFLAVLWKQEAIVAWASVCPLFLFSDTPFPEVFKTHFLQSLESLLECPLRSILTWRHSLGSFGFSGLFFWILTTTTLSIYIYFLFTFSCSDKNCRGTKILSSSMPRRVAGTRRC